MKPNKHTDLQKEYRRLDTERWEIRDKIRSLGYTKLDTPIRHGWYYEMVLDPALEDNPKYTYLYKLLKDKGLYLWGKDKKTAQTKYLENNSYYNSQNFFFLLTRKEFNRLPEKLHSLCVLNPYYTAHARSHRKIKHIAFRVKIPQNYITFKYTKSYITHRRILDPVLEARKAEIENLMETSKFYKFSAVGSSHWNDWSNDYKLDRKKSKISLRGLFKKENP